ncbi:ferredoxin [Patescibacteria group bacterium]|jgi:ferredoxin|nr:ferredoxin [Patescibacteria group bacterium]
MKIVVDQDACIGAASCVVIGAKTFGLNADGKAYILNEAPDAENGSAGDVISSSSTDTMDTRDVIIEAARSCPVFAIKLYEDDGTEIPL